MKNKFQARLAQLMALVIPFTVIHQVLASEAYIPENKRSQVTYPNDYPRHPKPPQTLLIPTSISEIEPNENPGSAQVVDLGPGPGQDSQFSISGSLSSSTDVDYYRVEAIVGDVIGVAMNNLNTVNPEVSIRSSLSFELVGNQNGGVFYAYPPESPLPLWNTTNDAYAAIVAHYTGSYFIRAQATFGGLGDYQLLLSKSRPGPELDSGVQRQIIYLDFDGATIDAVAAFGSGNSSAMLSPLVDFLGNWGLDATDEDAVIDAIIAEVEDDFERLRQSGLNGDRPADGVPGHFDYEIRNSRDHSDPWGGVNVSRVIIGGTINELGISTLGIAEFIDIGNFSKNDSAVVLLGRFGTASGGDNINNLTFAAGASIIDAIGAVVGTVTSHELGHYLGHWHQENANALDVIMDRGGNGVSDEAGVGVDGIFGTADDVDVDYLTDAYSASEKFTGNERSTVHAAYAFATGAFGVVFVDHANSSGVENGTREFPFDTLGEGQNAAPIAGSVVVKTGAYPNADILDKKVNYIFDGPGAVTLGY